MNLGELRGQLAGLLDAQLVDTQAQVVDHVPEELQPPVLVIQPAEPFLTEDPDATYAGEVLATYDVLALVDLGEEQDNEAAANQLDALLTAVLEVVRAGDWWLLSVSQPQPFATTDWVHHGCRATIRTRTTL